MILAAAPNNPAPAAERPRKLIRRAVGITSACGALLDVLLRVEREAKSAYELELERAVWEEMSRMPVDALKQASAGALRLGVIKACGFRTVAEVRSASRAELESIRGVGPATSARVTAAAELAEQAVRTTIRVRFDVDGRPKTQTALLSVLRSLDAERRHVGPLRARLEGTVRAVGADLKRARLEARPVRRFFAGPGRKAAARAAYERLAALVGDPDTVALLSEIGAVNQQRRADRARGIARVWDDYMARPVVYNGLLIDIAQVDPDTGVSQGFLPDEIVKRISTFDLDTSLLSATLRGYQTFGAKFALVQQRTILGDEMGLGKTIEALTVLCHLQSRGARHFLVVSPASVLANWEHEIWRHSWLSPTWRLHGPQRDRQLRRWARDGGVAVTTFDTLRALQPLQMRIAAVVVDEAHFVKNPTALRTKAVRSWLSRAEHSLLMSGTPMENRVEEFRNLVSHIRPELASRIRTTDGIAGADAFRRTVAPVYLRRNQTDVLDELPPKIETAEWLALEGPAAGVYRRAVASRNFMAMRRAAFLTPRADDSPKLRRLVEIVEEAANNNRKVVVFSFFREVIQRVYTAVGPLAAGSITGSLPAAQRQDLVNRFTTTPGPAVLINQIQAGGVGLNIQAASVVILTEPQWKPSTEEQAIARCHRMGQVRPVEVHRLLIENSVDELMLVILARKSALFADYVRASTMKDAAPEATDTTSQAPSQAEHEGHIIELERRRLGLDA